MLRVTQLAFLGSLLTSRATAQQNPTWSLSKDDNFNFEILATLGLAVYGGSDVGPVLGAANNLKAGDFKNFSDSFSALAFSTKEAAQQTELESNAVNARDTWYAAASYFRAADFYLHSNWSDPLIMSLWAEQRNAFDKANAALPIPGERVRLAANNFTVEAIWYAPSMETTLRPTIILGNGYDGSQEDLYHTVVVPALARGWNAITYEGPGQPTVRREQGIGFIPDWERVVTPVVDYLLTEKSKLVDPARLVLFGYSFGGYLNARAAAFEPRLSAVVLDGGIYDYGEAIFDQVPVDAQELFNSGNKTAFDAEFNALSNNPDAPTTLRWSVQQGLWSFVTHSPYDYLKMAQAYTLKNVVHQIEMPVLTFDAEYDQFFANQSTKIKEALSDQATYYKFNGTEGYHCQIGASQALNRVMFTWLQKTLG
jgi:pimeloyl-ACP methyl ester carboxylesterase